MKLSIILMGSIAFAVPAALAAPTLNERQNNIAKCTDGAEGPANDAFDKAADCEDKCFLREQADGDNKNGVCKGFCMNVGHPAPIIMCRTSWPYT